MKQKIFWAMALGSLSFVLLFTSVALATPGQSLISAVNSNPPAQALITHTETAAAAGIHPVAAALADRFDIDYAKIIALHENGIGFGVIARAYFMALRLNNDDLPNNDTSMEALLLEFQAGAGWGEIAKAHNLHPGRRGHGGSVGAIMSGKGAKEKKAAGEDAVGAKKKQPGPPDRPPGQAKDKGKGKDKGQEHDEVDDVDEVNQADEGSEVDEVDEVEEDD